MNNRELVRAVLEKLGPNGERWKKGIGWFNPASEVTDTAPDAPDACFCVGNAANLVLGTAQKSLLGAFESYVRIARILGFPSEHALFQWNDTPERTWEDVKARLEAALV